MNLLTKNMIAASLLASMATVMAADPAVVEKSFFPYIDGTPVVDGLTPGVVINAANADQFQSAVDPVLLQQIKDGWVEITVGETTDFVLHPNYISATEAGDVSLGETAGEIQNFVAGRAFPQEPDINDPRAGEKLAWNYQYGYNWGDNAAIYPFYWRYRNLETSKIERQIKFNFHFLNWKHRVNQAPVPEFEKNPSGLFRSIYVQVLQPFDVKNTQLLIHRYADDLKRDDAWLYLGFQRRVRRLASGQVTDAFLGSDLMIEDFEGYNGRISDMNWTYKGTQNVILPFYNHNDQALTLEFDDPDGYGFIDFHGKGDCYANVTWQLRKAYVLESSSVDPNHPISKRVHYVDAQTFTLPRTIIYDRKGEPWKSWYICQAHPDHHLAKNAGTGVSIDDCFSMIDVQAKHCTTGQFKGQVDPELNPVSLFTVQNLRAKGR
jgi:hypothetical protein